MTVTSVRLHDLVFRGGREAAQEVDQLRTQGVVNPDTVRAKLSADEFSRVQTRRAHFVEAAGHGNADAKITGIWCGENRGGLPRTRWHGPNDPETFYMKVEVKNGDAASVVPELWTNINKGKNPRDFEAYPMEQCGREGNSIIYKVTLPIEKVGNFRVSGRISTSADPANPKWQWANDCGVGDMRFRPRPVEFENMSEQVVHVGIANADPGDWRTSTLRDLIDPTFGKYNLWAVKAAGKNTIRLQPPFVHRRWDNAHPYDTLGSPYAATDYFSIDPRYSRDCHENGVQSLDEEKQRDVAMKEFWDVVDKAHELGMKVVLDIALNHTGHNYTFRDLFDDPVKGEQVFTRNFDQITVNDDQKKTVADRRRVKPLGTAEEAVPEMFAAKSWDAAGAHSVWETTAAGNGEWQDTKQLNTGAFNWGGIEKNADINESVRDWEGRVLMHWLRRVGKDGKQTRGVDGFRFDHSSNLHSDFFEKTLTQVQAATDQPFVCILEDFNQGEKLRVYADAMESGWFHDVIDKFKQSDIAGVHGIVNSDWFFETLRGGNHDEARVIELFDGDIMAAGRYLCMVDLFGGISTTVMGDEFGEKKKVEFKHVGGVPAVLAQAHYGQLGQGSVDLQAALHRAGEARNSDPSLRTALRVPLWPAGQEHCILGTARHADDRNVPGTLVFTNLANRDTMQNKFWLDGETRSRIDPNAMYQARDVMSPDPDRNVWGKWIKGQDLLDNGVFIKLNPYEIQALKIERMT